MAKAANTNFHSHSGVQTLMIHYITVAESGQIFSCGHTQATMIDHVFVPRGATLVLGVSISDPAQHYWDGATAQPIPLRPSFLHEFDYATKAWRFSSIAVRRLRDKLLAECDWTQLPDVPEATKAAWADYRQALRDLTAQDGFPDAIQWPSTPA